MPEIVKRSSRASAPLEKERQQEIRLALGAEADLVLWRNAIHHGEDWDPRTGRASFIKAGLGVGSADLVGVLRMPSGIGRFFALEIKRVGQKPSPEQLQWAALVRRLGGFVAVVFGVDDSRAALARARSGADE